jgi:hypothetical protein
VEIIGGNMEKTPFFVKYGRHTYSASLIDSPAPLLYIIHTPKALS